MCPYVERVRLALFAKGILFQTCQMNLQNRTKWHYEVNNGFVPILEIPGGFLLTESLNILEFIDRLTGDESFCDKALFKKYDFYSKNSVSFAR